MKDEVRNEILNLSVAVATIDNKNIYTVPQAYFDDLAAQVLSKLHLPLTQTPFSTPAPAYFEGLAGNILSKIKNAQAPVAESETREELKQLSPLLAGIGNSNVYAVPEGYFSSFTVNTSQAEQPAKIVAMKQPVKWIKYMAAAAIAGIVVTGGILFVTNKNTETAGTKGAAAYNTQLAKISDAAIANYLDETTADIDIVPAAYDDKAVPEVLVRQLLNDASDTDIQQYLQENKERGEKDIKGI